MAEGGMACHWEEPLPKIKPGRGLPKEKIFKGRFKIEERIGTGGFGDVYSCIDIRTLRPYAMKVVSNIKPANPDVHYLNIEASVLKDVRGEAYFPRFYSHGRTDTHDYIVMELLGMNLRDLKKKQPDKKFEILDVLHMGKMMLKSIESLHQAGYLHRDIKPQNFTIGTERNAKKVYLIDFGLSKRFVSECGDLIPSRTKVPFKGTIRYASAHVLSMKDAGRRDDLISLLYTLIELTMIELPWKNVHGCQEMANIKLQMDHHILTKDFPGEFQQFFNHIRQLRKLDKPDYRFLHSVLCNCISVCMSFPLLQRIAERRTAENEFDSSSSLNSDSTSNDPVITTTSFEYSEETFDVSFFSQNLD
ncbi:tau-tubulin kinase 2 [Caerostris darwini]|uniref:non-specific serine/threonine protein kinase n=1 Tax=Caerostris darwini TaxID=1538125 RepID=A0AAV4TFN7_9ARAC|nr:tau-tubulin kinase 2 [Caerostris darwini]